MNRTNISLGALYVLFAVLFLSPLVVAWQKERDGLKMQKATKMTKRFEVECEQQKTEAIASLVQSYPTFKESGVEVTIPKVKRGDTATLLVRDESYLGMPPGFSMIFEDTDSCNVPPLSGMDVVEGGHENSELYWTISKDKVYVAGEGYLNSDTWSVLPQAPFTKKGWEANIPPALEGQHPYTCTPAPRGQFQSKVEGVEVTFQVHENAPLGAYKYQLFAGVPGLGPTLYAGHTVIFEVH